jgi:hypothetical protein
MDPARIRERVKLKRLREHYVTKDKGKTWIPKLSFTSKEEIELAGFLPNKWHIYRCTLCDNLHVARFFKDRNKVDDNG